MSNLMKFCYTYLTFLVFIHLFNCTPPILINTSDITTILETIPSGEWKEEPIIIVKDSTLLRFVVDQNGNKLYQTRKILYYINDRSYERFQKIPISYNTLFEIPPEFICKTLCKDGTTWSITSDKLERYPAPSEIGFNSNRYIQVISLPHYQNEMLIELTIKRTFNRPEFFSSETFAESSPVLKRNITFQFPHRSQIKFGVLNGQKLDIRNASWTSADSFTTVSYNSDVIRSIENPDMFFDASEWVSALYLSLPPRGSSSYSWSQLGDHYLSIIRDVYSQSGNIVQFAKDLRCNLSADSSMREILLLLRKKIRYHGNFDGIHAIKPHTVESIIENGYGDCKDMAVLCQSIAKQINISTDLVLLNSQSSFQPRKEYPTLGSFDHVIVSFRNLDGTVHFVDPTIAFGEPLNSAQSYDGKKCFSIRPENSILDTIPGPSQSLINIQSDSKVFLDKKENRWRIEGTIIFSSIQALRLYTQFRDLSFQERPSHLKQFLERFFELTTESVSFTKMTADTISVLFSASFHENYIPITNGGIQLNKPSIFGGYLRFTTLPYYGLACYNGMVQKDSWTLPPGYTSIDRGNFSTSFSEGNWNVDGNSVTRIYKQCRTCVSKEDAGNNTTQKNRFVNATIWR